MKTLSGMSGRQLSLAAISLGFAVAASLTSFYFAVSKPSNQFGLELIPFIKKMNDYDSIKNEFKENKQLLIQANLIAESFKDNVKSQEFSSSLLISEIQANQVQLEKKIDNLYNAIESNPEKSLSIPMVNKDMKILNEKIQTLSDGFEHQLDRTYQMFMWICGTLGLGMIGMTLTIFIGSRGKE